MPSRASGGLWRRPCSRAGRARFASVAAWRSRYSVVLCSATLPICAHLPRVVNDLRALYVAGEGEKPPWSEVFHLCGDAAIMRWQGGKNKLSCPCQCASWVVRSRSERTTLGSRDATDNGGAEQAGQGDREFLPQTDQSLEPRVVGARVRNPSAAAVVLPLRWLGQGAPLLLEVERTAVRRRAAKIEHRLTALHRALLEVPVEQHVGIGPVELLERAGAGHFRHAMTVQEQRRRDRSLPRPHDAQFGIAGELAQDAAEQDPAVDWGAEVAHVATENLVEL